MKKNKKPEWRLDRMNPGIIRFDEDPLSGILAGIKAKEIVRAMNSHDELVASLKIFLEKDGPITKGDCDRARAALIKAEKGHE